MAEQAAGPQGYLAGMPSWAKVVVTILTILPLSVAISGRMLDISVGPLLERYLDIQFTKLEASNNETEAAIIAALDEKMLAINAKIDELNRAVTNVDGKVVGVEERVRTLEVWACNHSATQGLRQDAPPFCE